MTLRKLKVIAVKAFSFIRFFKSAKIKYRHFRIFFNQSANNRNSLFFNLCIYFLFFVFITKIRIIIITFARINARA